MRLFLSPKGRRWSSALLVAVWLLSFTLFLPAQSIAAPEPSQRQNKLLALSVEGSGAAVTVKIDTEKPLGYRYTVYDSVDPLRVVIDMPGMNVAALPADQKVAGEVLEGIRISTFDLTSGVLGRIELLLTAKSDYNVVVEGNQMRLVLAGVKSNQGQNTAEIPQVVTSTVDSQEPILVADGAKIAASALAPQQFSGPAKILTGINISPGVALLQTDGVIDKYKYFTLKSPNRLVVDLYGVKPSFKERVFSAGVGFDKLRIGTYPDKVRLVFDAGKRALPANWVDPYANVIQVSWGSHKNMPAAVAAVAALPATALAGDRPVDGAATRTVTSAAGVVSIENVEFKLDGDKSLLVLTLSSAGVASDPVIDGNLIHFDVKNAEISRALRRVIDTSSFPSVVRQVTPYIVQEKGKQDVRFAVQIKGVVPFVLQRDGKVITLALENQGFTEIAPVAKETLEVPVPPAGVVTMTAEPSIATEPMSWPPTVTTSVPVLTSTDSAVSKGRKYSGQKISLVFDDADIRNILQLIAEVSDMNIIAGDEVKGNITLRLVDVPWDQALDLILDVRGLGMLNEGNVIRIMQAKEMRALKLERLKDLSAIDDTEPTVTKIFVVRFAPVEDIATKIQTLLGKAGESGGNNVTWDNRTRQIIVTARPSKLLAIEEQLLARLDVRERQVMIEARIVEASDSFSRQLGVNWGISSGDSTGSNLFGSGNQSTVNVGGGGSFMLSPSIGTAGLATGITFGKVGIDSTVLDLRISALETSGFGRVVSTPRITTLNGSEATINQGVEIPYTSTDADGKVTTLFKKAELALKVLPVINPGNTLVLDIDAKNDSVGAVLQKDSPPAVDTKQAKTRVLVQDGETTVIGGIFIESEDLGISGIPVLQHIPLLGHLFKSSIKGKKRSELLIFITPRILD